MRRRILDELRAGPLPVGELADRLPVSRPAISKHLRVLESAALVRHQAHGTRRVYELDTRGLAALREWLDAWWEEPLKRYAAHVEETLMPTTDTTIRKERDLSVAPERAFEVFTAGIADWWPVASHSVGGDDTVNVTLEPRVGGRITETTRRGETHLWGTVLAWEPPHRLVVDWHPGHAPDDATEVEVRFEPRPDGCRLVLEHRGWERVTWADRRPSYDSGWNPVLARYVESLTSVDAPTASPMSPGPA